MSNDFKRFIILYMFCAILIFAGFYLTFLPTIIQIILLLAGVILTIYTLIKITQYFLQQKNDNA